MNKLCELSKDCVHCRVVERGGGLGDAGSGPSRSRPRARDQSRRAWTSSTPCECRDRPCGRRPCPHPLSAQARCSAFASSSVATQSTTDQLTSKRKRAWFAGGNGAAAIHRRESARPGSRGPSASRSSPSQSTSRRTPAKAALLAELTRLPRRNMQSGDGQQKKRGQLIGLGKIRKRPAIGRAGRRRKSPKLTQHQPLMRPRLPPKRTPATTSPTHSAVRPLELKLAAASPFCRTA